MSNQTYLDRAALNAPPTELREEAPTRRYEQTANPLLAVGLCVGVYSLFFEDAVPGFIEPSTIGLAFYFLTLLTQPKLAFRRPTAAIKCFALFLFIVVAGTLFITPMNPGEVAKRTFQLCYLIFFAWTISNLVSVPKLMTLAVGTVASATLTISFLQITGIGARPWTQGVGHGRMTTFGFHPNQLGMDFALGACCVLGLSSFEETKKRMKPWLSWLLLAILAFSIVETGSRGALIALAIGLVTFSTRPGNKREKRTALAMMILGFLAIIGFTLNNQSTMDRINATVDQGNVAGRDLVYEVAVPMFLQKPIFGWGVAENTYVLGDYLQEPGLPSKDTHNLMLYVLTSTGIVGGIPFFWGVFLAIRNSWRARRSSLGVLPFTLIMCLMAGAMGLSLLQTKPFWLVIGITVGSIAYVRQRYRALWESFV